MKKALVFLFAAFGKLAYAQYKPVDIGSDIQFKVRNFGFNVSGSLTGLSGRIKFDPELPAEASFDVSVDPNTINTGIDMRDDHLKKFSYLDAKDHTQPVTFPFTAEATQGGYHFKGMFTINRKDFDVGGSSTISDEVQIALSIIAK